jgi:hypothetical protein
MNAETKFIQEEYLQNENSEGSDENFEEYGELEIDLDYNDQPLDLSMKHKSINYDHAKATKLPTLEIKPIFNLSKFDNNNVITTQNDNTIKFVTELEVTKLLEPYVKSVHKKFSCTVCDMKFVSKVKAVTHVENKHVDCLQYKCPLCRGSKGTRLAYESHLRRGHGVKVNDYSPLIRCKKKFSVKSEALSSNTETQVCQQYDFQFVTFLRHILGIIEETNTSTSNWHKTIPCAEWINQDQGIFKINNRHQFSTMWSTFKVITAIGFPHILYSFIFQNVDCVSWESLYSSVIIEFINRNIFKQLSGDLVFQVFSIKQLLK